MPKRCWTAAIATARPPFCAFIDRNPQGHIRANNLLDRDPPVSMSATLNGYDASTYDIPGGRFLYAQLAFER